MARRLTIEMELDDKGMARKLRVNKDAVVDLADGIDTATKKSRKFGDITSVAFGQLAAQGIAGLLSGISRLASRGFGELNKAVEAAGIQQIADNKLRQALKNLGDTSEESFQKLKASASALQDVSNFGDEAINTAQAMLLSFSEVAGAEGAQLLTSRLADVAAGVADAEGNTISLNSVAAALGKSLGGTAASLREYGISLSKSQEEQFNTAKGMEKVVLLTEILDANFKGLAEATRDPFKQLQNDVGDLREQLGAQLRPEITAMADDMRAFVKDPQTVGFVKEIGQAVVATIKGAMRVFEFFGGISRALRAQIRLTIGQWREFQVGVINGALKITTTLESVSRNLGFSGMAGQLAELNKELQIQGMAIQIMADGEKALAAEILAGNQAMVERQEILTGGSGGGGSTGGSGTGSGAGSGEQGDPLAQLKKRREELIMQGQITQELISLNRQIAQIEMERAFVREGSQVRAIEAAEMEKVQHEDEMARILEKKNAEIEAAAAVIAATEAERKAKQQLAKEQAKALAGTVAANAQQVLSSQNAGEAIKTTIKGIIQAKLAQLIASALAPLGPAAIVAGPLVAAGVKGMFNSLVPGFNTGGTVGGPPGNDNVLARLTPGEEVINANAAAQNRPLLKAINSGLPASAAMHGMSMDININGQLTATSERVVARLDETSVQIQNTRGQIRTERP